MSLISDANKDMIEQMTPLDQASKKIKAVSKVLPQLIGQNDSEALELLISLFQKYITIDKLHLNLPPSQKATTSEETFTSKFYIERLIDITESIPVHKSFIKDAIASTAAFSDLLTFLSNESAQFRDPETDRAEDLN